MGAEVFCSAHFAGRGKRSSAHLEQHMNHRPQGGPGTRVLMLFRQHLIGVGNSRKDCTGAISLSSRGVIFRVKSVVT